jgi:hypothetical protein
MPSQPDRSTAAARDATAAIKPGPWQKGAIYGSGMLLLASGALWLVIHYFGATADAWAPWCLKLHGLAAMAALVAIGALMPVHMRKAWRLQRNRAAGVALGILCLALALTGYGLYYFGGEALRAWTSVAHWAMGLVAAPAIVWHAAASRKEHRRNKRAAPCRQMEHAVR